MSTRLSTEERHEREMLALIDERDAAQEWADKLAYAIAPQSVIGEHTSINSPWVNALEAVESLQVERDAARRALRDLTRVVTVENRGMGRTTLHISQDDLRSACEAARAVLSENSKEGE